MNLWGREARSAKAVPPGSPHSPVPEETDPHPRNMAGMGIMPASFGRDEEGSTDGPDQASPGVPFVSALLEGIYTQFQYGLGFRALEEMGVMPIAYSSGQAVSILVHPLTFLLPWPAAPRAHSQCFCSFDRRGFWTSFPLHLTSEFMIPAMFFDISPSKNVALLNYAAVIWVHEQMSPVEPSPLSDGGVSLQLGNEPMLQLKYILFLQNKPPALWRCAEGESARLSFMALNNLQQQKWGGQL